MGNAGSTGRTGFGQFAFIILCVILLIRVVLWLLAARGCSTTSSRFEGAPLFSPDSSVIACLHTTTSTRPIPTHNPVYSAESVAVRWCSSKSPQQFKETKVDSLRLDGNREYLDHRSHLSFSPDSKHLAVVYRRGVLIIELATGRSWRPVESEDPVTSLAWLSGTEIAYVLHGANRLFCRQAVADTASQRIVVHQDEADPDFEPHRLIFGFPDAWPTEYWSHGGRHVVFNSRRKLKLLDVTTGDTHEFGRPHRWSPQVVAVSWKPDDSAVLCIRGDEDDGYEAVVLEPATHEITDVSTEFEAAFGEDSLSYAFSRPGETAPSTRWTPDGQYFVVNCDNPRGGFLVQPRPWKVIPLGDRIRQLVGPPPPERRLDHEGRPYVPYADIHPTPITGWVLTDPEFTGRHLLVDHEGRTVVDIQQPTWTWAGSRAGPVISPDTTLAAYVDSVHGVKVEPVPRLPTSKPD